MALTQSLIDTLAREAGFTAAGIAAIPAPDTPQSREERRRFEDWIASGAAGEMDYLKRRNESGDLVRSSVRAAFPWAQSVIVCVANYNAGQHRSIDPAPPGSGWIARYAQSGSISGSQSEAGSPMRPTDYHKVLLRRLEALDARLHESLGPFESRCYVDTGPLVERVYARYAGLGWTGKNTCILNQQLGSWFFLGVILTSLELPSGELPPLAPDRCGSCTRCIDACPTQALTPYQMDATRCISYLTIEKRGAIREDLREGIGRQVFGCDICQDVCPWNTKAPVVADPELAPRPQLINPALDWLASLDEAAFGTWFFGSPIKRARFAGFRRNLAIAMGNSGLARFRATLEAWSNSEDPVLAESAAWALRKLDSHIAGCPTSGFSDVGAKL
ncbi:MAG TPA: tRNA epoxyqueuosine(34) reductase QueG [Silvibacterium sp.]|nr:tRNA epoxyqueuosine(34) reductase QueG [Silvibacterium sp.]